jgi:hypothetical protein
VIGWAEFGPALQSCSCFCPHILCSKAATEKGTLYNRLPFAPSWLTVAFDSDRFADEQEEGTHAGHDQGNPTERDARMQKSLQPAGEVAVWLFRSVHGGARLVSYRSNRQRQRWTHYFKVWTGGTLALNEAGARYPANAICVTTKLTATHLVQN